MAWRIAQFLVRGEIDNRERGRVTGRLWFDGQPEPIVLALDGNAWRDLAGHRLEILNPRPQPGLPPALTGRQSGRVGDITASRKVKVPAPSGSDGAAGAPPWHWANCLYLEWYSEQNGRVVIESVDYTLTIDPEPAWTMSAGEEDDQRAANATPSDVVEELRLDNDDRAMTEEEAERLQAESDQLNDRVHERMEREGPEADLGRIIEEEIERARRERGEPDPTPEEREEQRRWIEDLDAAAQEMSIDETPEVATPPEHPLAGQARALSMRVLTELDAHDWVPAGAGRDHPLMELQTAVYKAGGKLAGALSRREWPPPRVTCASTIVWLKRANQFLQSARLAAAVCRRRGLASGPWLNEIDNELAALGAETSRLIAELRVYLSRGFG